MAEKIPFVTTIPKCEFCADEDQGADYLCPQSTDGGATVEWVLACKNHAEGWWDGSDWRGIRYDVGQASLGDY